MKKNNLLLVLILLFINISLSNSQLIIKGKVVDSLEANPIKDALIMALKVKDSTLLSFTRTDQKGEYSLKNLSIDTFEIIIGYPNFEDNSIFVFGNANESQIVLPTSKLLKVSKKLKEIVIHANNKPIYFSGDTLVFVADSFKVKEREIVEDLLRKLPGVKVDIKGKITYQGKNVDRLYVDGDEFFGKDPLIVTKNLEATMIDKVQVYEEGANSDKVMNLTLKEEAKNGTFGKGVVASDGIKFNEAETILNKYDKKRNIGFFFLKNNTPKSVFSFEDSSKVETNSYLNSIEGFPKNFQSGTLFKDVYGKKNQHSLRFNYSFTEHQANKINTTLTQTFLLDSTITNSTENNQENLGKIHKLNLKYVWKIDSLTKFSIEPTLTLKNSINKTNNKSNYLNNKQMNYRFSNALSTDSSEAITFTNTLILEKNYLKKNRITTLSNTSRLNPNNTYINSDFKSTDIYNLNLLFNQKFENKSFDNSFVTNISHTEPLLKKILLTTKYTNRYSSVNQNKSTFDISNNIDKLNSSLSSNFTFISNNNIAVFVVNYKHKNHSYSIKNNLNLLKMDLLNLSENSKNSFTYFNYLPDINYIYNKRSSLYISLSANKQVTYPNIDQLQPILSNVNPNNRVIGNADLVPSISNNLELNIYKKLSRISEYLNLNITSSYINNDFVSAIDYDSLGVSTTKTDNINGIQHHRLLTSLNKQLVNNKLYFSITYTNDYNIFYNKVNQVQTKTEQLNFTPSIGIEYYTDKLNISVNSSTSYTKPLGTIYNNSNSPFYTFDNNINFEWTTIFDITINCSMNQYTTSGRPTDFNINRSLLNTHIEREFMKSKNLKVSIELYDILNQNKGITRIQNLNQIIDLKSNLISRYYLFRISYRILKIKSKS
jgi:hypothetical protein